MSMLAQDLLLSVPILVALIWSRIQSAEDYCALAHRGKHIPAWFREDDGDIHAAIDAMHGSLYCTECRTIVKQGNPFWYKAWNAMPKSIEKQFRDGKHWSDR